MKMEEVKYCLKPCAGDTETGVKDRHMYKVINPKGSEEGFMTLKEAEERFGIEKISISNSHTICPNCGKAKMRRS